MNRFPNSTRSGRELISAVWVVHSQKYREHDAIVRLVGAELGGLRAFYRGVFRKKNSAQRIQIGDYGRAVLRQGRSGDGWTLVDFELQDRHVEYGDDALFQAQCAYVLEWYEQIGRAPSGHEPLDQLVSITLKILKREGHVGHVAAAILRTYEFKLLSEAGYLPHIDLSISQIGVAEMYYDVQNGTVVLEPMAATIPLSGKAIELIQLVQYQRDGQMWHSILDRLSDDDGPEEMQEAFGMLGRIFIRHAQEAGCSIPTSAKLLRALRSSEF